MPRSLRLALAVSLLALSACSEPYDRPDRPLPSLSGSWLDGKPFGNEDLAGKPWLINVWVPG